MLDGNAKPSGIARYSLRSARRWRNVPVHGEAVHMHSRAIRAAPTDGSLRRSSAGVPITTGCGIRRAGAEQATYQARFSHRGGLRSFDGVVRRDCGRSAPAQTGGLRVGADMDRGRPVRGLFGGTANLRPNRGDIGTARAASVRRLTADVGGWTATAVEKCLAGRCADARGATRHPRHPAVSAHRVLRCSARSRAVDAASVRWSASVPACPKVGRARRRP
jgi:hypothetical protein